MTVLRATLVCALALAGPVSARTVLVLAPHPDDETIIAAGRIRVAVLAHDTVYLAVVTNGDLEGKSAGLSREGESVAAAAILGVPEKDVIFLGYGDQTLHSIWNSKDGSQVFTSGAKQSATYAQRGMGGKDFHSVLSGAPGPYRRDTVLGDFKALITRLKPDEIYTVSERDNHGDHAATARFLHAALVALQREGVDVRVKVFQSTVWAPYANGGCADKPWPPPMKEKDPLPGSPFTSPPCIVSDLALDWSRIQRFPQPAELLAPEPGRNLKRRALEAHHSQFSDFLASFVRRDEFGWRRDYGTDLTGLAEVSASSASSDGDGAASHAVDGTADQDHEWKSEQGHGAWIRLDWAKPVRVGQVDLFDRLDPKDNVLAGTLSFDDGSEVVVGALPTTGKPLSVIFPARTVRWMKFTIDRSEGYTPGLAELEVLGVPATRTGNVPPHLIRGPGPGAIAIGPGQTASFSVEAADLDGDPLTYAWTASAGTIAGQGPTAVLTPPRGVKPDTVITVTVQVSDGKGGVASNSSFVTITPPPRH